MALLHYYVKGSPGGWEGQQPTVNTTRCAFGNHLMRKSEGLTVVLWVIYAKGLQAHDDVQAILALIHQAGNSFPC